MSGPLIARDFLLGELPLVVAMLNSLEVAEAFDLRPPLDAAELQRGVLPSYDQQGRPGNVQARVRVHSRPGEPPLGVWVTYPLEPPSTARQEIDLALPGSHTRSPGLFRDAVTSMVHVVFAQDGTTFLRARIAVGRGARAFTKLLAAIGALPEASAAVIRPDGSREPRLLFWLTPERFYATTLGQAARASAEGTR